MSRDPIRIPVKVLTAASGLAIVTPEIARQIVALSGLPAWQEAHHHTAGEHERRIAALESFAKTHGEKLNTLCYLKAPLNATENTPGNHIREAFAAVGAPMVGKGVRADQPAAHGDDAAVEALMAVKVNATDYACNGWGSPFGASAVAILAAIRRGEVPGIYDQEYVGRAMQRAADDARKHHGAKPDAHGDEAAVQERITREVQHQCKILNKTIDSLEKKLAEAEEELREHNPAHWHALAAVLPAEAAQWKDAAEASRKAREDDRGRLQQKCSDWGCYWRASDAHGVKLSLEQAVELLQDALGVEVEIKDDARAEADQWKRDAWDTIVAIGTALGLKEPDMEADQLPPEWRGKMSEKVKSLRAETDAAQKEAAGLRALLKEACDEYLGDVDDDATWTESNRAFRMKCRAAGIEVEG